MGRQIFIIAVMLLLEGAAAFAQEAGGGHLYAVIINGGRNRLTNHERYWNDCAWLYQTLRHTYRVPKRNITVLMSDGGAPEDDMLRADGLGFVSSPTDLDGDGQPDIDQAATRQAVSGTLLKLSRQLTADDHLFLFVIDHGGTTAEASGAYLWLWNEERLADYALASLLDQIHAATVCILLGQCYSGGFMQSLMREGRVVTTACGENEQSWACPDRPYDEFVYHWTCAVNGADETGQPVEADTDGDGQVSMGEAFRYACRHDSRNETPQFGSWPEQLGELWTFSNANMGTLGIRALQTDEKERTVTYSLSGIRREHSSGRGVYLERRGGKTRKIIR